MAARSSIEWTDATWNPVTGCTKVSPGCDHCYAQAFAERWRGTPGHHFEHGFDIVLRPERLTLPLRWSTPRRIFVNSMSDLFHDQVPEEFIASVWTTMARTPQHTYQILTKRHARMRSVVRRIAWRTPTTAERAAGVTGPVAYVQRDESLNEHLGAPQVLPNVWLGVSVEDQKRADLRLPALLETPAAVRFVSAEPLLGPIYLTRAVAPAGGQPGIDWVIAGGESGPHARPMHPDWARDLRDQCRSAGVAFFFKQWGEWAPGAHSTRPGAWVDPHGNAHPTAGPGRALVSRWGKKHAGQLLDGRAWAQFPTSTLEEAWAC